MTNSPGWKATPRNVPTGHARALVVQCSRAAVSHGCICFPGLIFQGSMPSIAAHATGLYRIICNSSVWRRAAHDHRSPPCRYADGQGWRGSNVLDTIGGYLNISKKTPPQTTLDYGLKLRHVSCVKDQAPRTILRTIWHEQRNYASKFRRSA